MEKKIIRFTAEWCLPCKTFGPIFESVASELNDFALETVDVDLQPDLAKELDIKSVPTTMVFVDGKNVATRIGGMTKNELVNWAKSFAI